MRINIRQYRCLLVLNERMVNVRGEELKENKTQIFARRGYEENLEFFRSLNIRGGEELLFQKYIHDGWVTKNKKTMGRGVLEYNS
jgi:hypothetical protein